MTKAKTKTQSPTEDNGSPTEAEKPAVKTKRPRGAARNKAAMVVAAATDNSKTASTTASTPKPARQTKAALLRSRLSEPGGVSLATLIELTGWQAHTLRATLSGLRKEGLPLTRRRDGEYTIYAIEATEPEAPRAEGETMVPEPEGVRDRLTDTIDGSADLAPSSVSTGSDA